MFLKRRLEHGRNLLRPGFTLVEILVAIGIASLLLALLLPAVQGARNSARRMQCASNQRQLLMAIANYHDSYAMLPLSSQEWTDMC
jgi:prepilin-type N-terminal cleavage/methylation domain-containing protein